MKAKGAVGYVVDPVSATTKRTCLQVSCGSDVESSGVQASGERRLGCARCLAEFHKALSAQLRVPEAPHPSRVGLAARRVDVMAAALAL